MKMEITVKELIKFLEKFDEASEIIFQDHNWNIYSGYPATSSSNGKPVPVIVVGPEYEEEEEE